ncbi:hypothetical protein HYH03_016009 [Edaphochlamys debaryana]|uniref:RRM Nup35-type domain-containing protein n=1 Tax=Edaphochlamys debaryana TaxID=47281 RepID=A0A835XJG8_9CHLO|nr:hypothetical protein HYH03_016009 [Edaphochlamys debaryana]|eukprot:KAG2485223.1 hypothetical protein HYH03_016009 [Edaphochlamys debaryana]
MVADATPAPPPPIMRLAEDVVMDEPGSAARGATPPGRQTPQQAGLGAGPAPPQQSLQQSLGFEQQQPPYEDVWVTIFGFGQADVPLVLSEFHRCGDIISWGFGEPASNFIHVRFQNKHGAQRALIRNGELLTPSLIVGVKPLDPRHRARVAALAEGAEDPAAAYKPRAVPERPYRVEAASVQVPQQNRNMVTRVFEYVLGL